MSSPERRKRAERPRPQKNTELAEVLKRIREESGAPVFSRVNDTPPPLSHKKEKRILKRLPPEVGRAKPRRVTMENGKTRVEVFDDEIGAYVQDPKTVSPENTPPPVPLLNIEPGIVEEARKESWQRKALLAKARGLDAMPPPLPQRPPPIHGAEERLESERTTFEQTENDLHATFKKTFMPALTEEEREASVAARLVAHKFAARKEPESVEPQSGMIKRLDAWIRGEKERAPRRQLEERLMRHFPALKAKTVELSVSSDAVANAVEQFTKDAERERRRLGLEQRHKFGSAWFRERYDALQRMSLTRFMIPLSMSIGRVANSRKLRYALPAAAFLGALSGLSSALHENADVFSHLHAPADSLPAFAPDSIADVSIPHPIESAAPAVNADGPPRIMMVNGDSAGATVESPAVEAGEAKPSMADEGAHEVAEPIEVRGNISVWSSLLDGLGEKGIDLSENGEQAFAQAVQRAIEDTGTQPVFIEHKGEGLSGAAWDKIPDGATIHFDLLFRNLEFIDRLKELLESSEYRSLGKELQSVGGVDAFISDVQDAFGVRYL